MLAWSMWKKKHFWGLGTLIVLVGIGGFWWRGLPAPISQPFLGKVVLLQYTEKGAHNLAVIDTQSLTEERYPLKDRPYNNVSVRDNDIYLSIYRENKGPFGSVSAGNRIAHFRFHKGKASFVREFEIPGYHPTTIWITTANVFVLVRRLEDVVTADGINPTGMVVLDRKHDAYKGVVSFDTDFIDSRWDFSEEKQRLFLFGNGARYPDQDLPVKFVQFLEISLDDFSIRRTSSVGEKKGSGGLSLSGLVKGEDLYTVVLIESNSSGQPLPELKISTLHNDTLATDSVSGDFYYLTSVKGQPSMWATNGKALLRLNKDFEIVGSIPCTGIRDIQWVDGKLWVVRRATMLNGFDEAPVLDVYDPETLALIKSFKGSYGHVGYQF
jgi:hypothetical protein